MNISTIKSRIPDHAKDLRLNLGNIIDPDSSTALDAKQVFGTAVACAYAVRSPDLLAAVLDAAGDKLDQSEIEGAEAAAAIMGMNNVYYRFTHMVSDDDYARLPARLRMNVIGNPGIDKVNFELYSLAVSAINGCGMCIDSHEKTLRKADVAREGIQDAVRIASVINAVAVVLENESSESRLRDAA